MNAAAPRLPRGPPNTPDEDDGPFPNADDGPFPDADVGLTDGDDWPFPNADVGLTDGDEAAGDGVRECRGKPGT